MNRLMLARRLRLILIGVALCGLLFYLILLPAFLRECFPQEPHTVRIYLCFLLPSSIPCYLVLVFGWGIVRNIRQDRSFSQENARLLRRISTLAAVDALYIFLGNPLLLLWGVGEWMFFLLALMIVFVGIAVSVAAAALSHLVLRAAELQEQSDLTV